MALTGIELSAGIVVGGNKPIDAKFGPYATTAAALADIGATLRYKGLTVGIEENGKVVEYWFGNGILDTDLAIKISPASEQLTTVESNLAALTADLASEVTRATTAEATLTTDLASEVARATAADDVLTDDISTQLNRAIAAEAQLTTDLTAEVTRATAAEDILADDIAAVDLRIDNVLENLDPAKIDSFTEVLNKLSTDKGELSDAIVALGTTANSALGDEITRATAAETQLATDLASEVTRATAAETQLTTDLASEVTRATAAETQLDTNLTAEITTRTSEITRVDGLITAHDTRLTAAQTSIAGLGTISTQDSDDVNITGGTISGVSINAESIEVGVGTMADLYIGQNGKVGIGTETPTEKLTVNGNIDLTGGALKNVTGISVPEGSDFSISAPVVISGAGNSDWLSLNPYNISSNMSQSTFSFEERAFRANGIGSGNQETIFDWNFDYTPGDSGNDTNIVRVRELNTKADKWYTQEGGDVVYGASVLWDGPQSVPSLVLSDGGVGFYNGMEEAYRKDAQTNFSNALDLQKKLVVSDTAPAHIDGREWLDTTDFRRYISISSAWVESITA